MATRKRADPIGDEINELRAAHSASDAGTELLRAALARSEPRVITAAAKLARHPAHASLCPALVATFGRLARSSYTADYQCLAKQALIETLTSLGHDEPDVFLLALDVVQYDPAFPGPEETAGGVRAAAALALAMTTIDRQRFCTALAPLLFDASPSVRQNTVRALGAMGSWEALLLVRVKVAAGDAEPAVIGECFVELLNADVESGLALTIPYLTCDSDSLRLQAVCALTESRDPAGTAAVIECCRTSIGDLEDEYLALGRSRHDEATVFLRDVLEHGSASQQRLATRALAGRR